MRNILPLLLILFAVVVSAQTVPLGPTVSVQPIAPPVNSGAAPTFTTNSIAFAGGSMITDNGSGALSLLPKSGQPFSVNGLTITASTGTLTITNGKTLSVSSSITFTGTDGTTMTFPSTSATLARTDATNTFSGTQTFSGPVYSTNGVVGANSTSIYPLIVYVNSVSVLTSGTPADIATITIPSGITRWHAVGVSTSSTSAFLAESASGTLAGAAFQLNDAANGAGTVMLGSTAGPGNTIGAVGWPASSSSNISTSSTVYVRQTTNSANAGTMSFYVVLMPLP